MAISIVASAQTNYVFYNATSGYIYNNNGTVDVKPTFDESCIWTANNALVNNSNSTIRPYGSTTQYLQWGNSTLQISETSSNFRGSNNYLCRRRSGGGGSNNYIRYNGSTFSAGDATDSGNDRFTYYQVTITNATTPTFSISYPTADAYVGNVNGTMSISANVSGNYRPKYYSFNGRYYLEDGTDYGTTAPSQVSNYTYTYELVGECANYATISGNTVTYTTDAGHDVVAQVKVTAKLQVYNNVVGEGTCTFILRSATIAVPTITRIDGTNQYQITTTAQGATIKYTTDGTDIDASGSNGTTYSGPVTVTTPNTTIKAKAVREGHVSAQTEYTITTVTLTPPTININDAGAVTITNPNGSIGTIHYTTDGSEPTASSSTYSGSFNVNNMATVKSIVTGNTEGYITSTVASKQYKIESGVSGGVVTLNDYEDHNWSYYSDPESPIKSLYPRNVKITYYGNGKMYTNNNTTTTIADGTVPNVTDASGVAVSRYEPENTFVFYKTLERDANNSFPYELIPNPFSKRPVSGTDGTTKWRGFYKWRVKSVTGGGIYAASTGGTALGVGDLLDADKEYYFRPTDSGQTNANNATSMEVEFEAVWARAYRVECNANAVSTNLSSGDLKTTSYERNFVVVKSGTGAGINNASQKPVTVMMVEPDGSSDYRTNSSYIATTSNDIIAQNTLKIEWCNVRARYISANAKDMILGRGITYNCGNGSYGTLGTTNCASYVSGIGTLANTTGTNYPNEINHKFRIESGIYGDLNFTSRAGDGLRGYASGLIYQYCIVGNDYERASKDGLTSNNARLHIKNHISQGVGGNGATFSNSNHNNAGRKTFDLVIKSGYVGSDYDDDINGTSWNANYEQVVYIGVSTSQRTPGYRSLTLEGGNISGISGGVDRWGSTSTTTKEYNMNRPSVYIRMKGSSDYPIVRGPIYAGAANAPTYGSRTVIATGGIIKGWLAGGCNGNDNQEGKNFGPSYIYVGGNASVNSNNKSTTFGAGGAIGGMVFAAGSGKSDNASSGRIEYGTHLTIADNAYIERNAFGGGNYGFSVDSTKIFITGGRVHGSVFGGANLRGGNTVNIVMNGGLIEGGLYGGSNQNGTISSNVTMQINGGQVGTSTTPANIHGGGYGASTIVSGNVDVTLGTKTGEDDVTYTTSGDAVIYGDVYGGSALGKVNGTTVDGSLHTNVTLNAGTIHGSLYGGGLGQKRGINGATSNIEANVYGNVQVTVYGGSVKKTNVDGSGGVYGCNNINGAPQRNVTVEIYGTDPAPAEGQYALFSVYGGGNGGAVTGNTDIIIGDDPE